MTESIKCPFCNDEEDDYDKPGLAHHLSGYCSGYNDAMREFEKERRARDKAWLDHLVQSGKMK